jgi:hypothetical protein
LSNWKGASGRDNPVASNYHSSVVKRRILEKEIHYEASVYVGIDAVPGLDNIVKGSFVGKYDQRACILLRHASAGLCNLLDSGISHLVIFDSEESVEYVTRPSGDTCLATDPVEEMPYLGLEDHNQRKNTDIEQGIHYRTHHLHPECGHNGLHQKEKDKSQEDIHGRRIPYETDQEINDQANHKDVQNVHHRKRQKTE